MVASHPVTAPAPASPFSSVLLSIQTAEGKLGTGDRAMQMLSQLPHEQPDGTGGCVTAHTAHRRKAGGEGSAFHVWTRVAKHTDPTAS